MPSTPSSVRACSCPNYPVAFAASLIRAGQTMWGLVLLLAGLAPGHAAISVGLSGSAVDAFSNSPPASSWSTKSLPGSSALYGSAATVGGLDAGINGPTNAANTITGALALAGAPPGLLDTAQYSTNGQFLCTRPTGNAVTLLMAALRNDSGTTLGSFAISYTLTDAGNFGAEALAGHRVYYNVGGAAGNWVSLGDHYGENALTNQAVTIPVLLSAPWPAGTTNFLLFVDVNNVAPNDAINELDNFFISQVGLACASCPGITNQPQSQSPAPGTNVTFTVGAVGTGPLTYQWHVNCRNISRATNASLTITNVGPLDVGNYTVTVSNLSGRVTSRDAVLALGNVVLTPLHAAVSGSNVQLRWPWRSDVEFSVQEAASLNTLPVPWTNLDVYVTRVGTNQTTTALTNGTTHFYRLREYPVRINAQPAGQAAALGANVALNVNAIGTPPFSYQWRLNGFNVPGATNATLVVNLTNQSQYGAYHVSVDDATAFTGSRPAVLRPAGQQTFLSDSFTARPLFNSSTGTIHGVTYAATKEAGENDHAGLPGGKSVWLRWRAPSAGYVSFDTIGSGFDTLLAAYTGSNVAGLTAVTSDDDLGGELRSQIRFNVVTNVDYNLAVDGLAGAEGFYVLNWAFSASTSTIPILDLHPVDQVVPSNTLATFTVSAHGLAPLTNLAYQWYFNGTPIPGGQTGTNAVLNVGPGVTNAPPLLGPYFVDVSNSAGLVVRSRPAHLQFSSNPQFYFVTKPVADLLCDPGLVAPTNCCGAGLAASGKKPDGLLSAGIGLTVGALINGPAPTVGCGSRIEAWVWNTNGWDTSARISLTGQVTTASSGGRAQVIITDPVNPFNYSSATATGANPKAVKIPPSGTPVAAKTYYIGLGRTPASATSFSVTYKQ